MKKKNNSNLSDVIGVSFSFSQKMADQRRWLSRENNVKAPYYGRQRKYIGVIDQV